MVPAGSRKALRLLEGSGLHPKCVVAIEPTPAGDLRVTYLDSAGLLGALYHEGQLEELELVGCNAICPFCKDFVQHTQAKRALNDGRTAHARCGRRRRG